jgi:hypothetical protein
MESTFFTMHDFMVFTKGAAYWLMGGTVLGILGLWFYIHGRDEEKNIK